MLLKETIISDTNIYNAIYSLESYIFEKGLLKNIEDDDIKLSDYELYIRLKNKYDFKLIDSVIGKCKKRLEKLLNDENDFFKISLALKIKKIEKSEEISYRPIYYASLIDQICMMALLNCIIFDDSDSIRKLSNINSVIPENFYGNIISKNVDEVFVSWRKQYKKYTDKTVEAFNTYKETKEFRYEVSLDFKNFFPTISPKFIRDIVMENMYVNLQTKYDDYNIIEMVLYKLLKLKVDIREEVSKDEAIKRYLKQYLHVECEENGDTVYYPKGIAQGLPHSYFFGNLCMSEISKIINKELPGKSFYYVDDSVIYTNEELNDDNFINKIENLNKNIEKYIEEYKGPINSGNNYCNSYYKFYNKKYLIQIHKEEKSSYLDLKYEIKFGKSFLKQINLGVSSVALDFNTTIDRLQDETLVDKIKLFYDAIKKEIDKYTELLDKEQDENTKDDNNIKEYKNNNLKIEDVKRYLKLLNRYKKFFEYRFKYLQLKLHRNNDVLYNYQEDYKYIKEHSDKINKFQDSIFQAETNMVLEYIDQDKKQELLKDIKRFEYRLLNLAINKFVEKDNTQQYEKKDRDRFLNGFLYYTNIFDKEVLEHE